jgi:hypothetical protein
MLHFQGQIVSKASKQQFFLAGCLLTLQSLSWRQHDSPCTRLHSFTFHTILLILSAMRTPSPARLCKLLIAFVQIFEIYFTNYLVKHLHRDMDWIVARIRVKRIKCPVLGLMDLVFFKNMG